MPISPSFSVQTGGRDSPSADDEEFTPAREDVNRAGRISVAHDRASPQGCDCFVGENVFRSFHLAIPLCHTAARSGAR